MKAIVKQSRRKSDVSRSVRRRHFTGSIRRAPKKNYSRSYDVSGQGESVSRRTFKWRSRHPSRQSYFRQRWSHGMARQDKSSNFYMARASPERRYGELWRQKSTWNSGVRKAIRRGSAEDQVRKHRDRETGAWKQISKQRRRVDVSYGPSMVTALQHGTWMDEEGFKRTCIKKGKKSGEIHQHFYGTWVSEDPY